MILINGNSFDVYITDSYDTFIDRIALHFNTLKKYLKFTPPEPKILQNFKGAYTVTNILEEIAYQEDSNFPPALRDEIKVNYPHLDIHKDVEELYLVTNTYINSMPEYALINLKGYTLPNTSYVWDKRKTIIKLLDQQINELRIKVTAHLEISNELAHIQPVEYTPFLYERSQYSLDFGPTIKTIEELFNEMKTTTHIPFIHFNKIYKIKTDFIPNPEWVKDENNSKFILLKVNNEKDDGIRELNDSYKKYNNVVFAVVNGHLWATLTIDLGRRYISQDVFQDRVIEIFNTRPPLMNQSDTNTIGVFYFSHQSFDTTIWADMVMNNPKFYNIFVVDESVRLTKIKKNVYMRSLYGSETIAMQMNIGEKGDLPHGILNNETYIRVRITKTTTTQRVDELQKIIGKLLTIYNEEYSKVVKEYKKYLTINPVKLLTVKSRKNQRDLQLGEIAPDIFFSRYTRQCPQYPKIISDDEAKDYKGVVMRFPIYNESVTRNYVCDHHKKETFPGLQTNKLANKNEFPYVPCCYVKDQRYLEGHKYRHYFMKEDLKKRNQTQDIFRTGKILPPETIGILPKKINDLFNAIDTPDYRFMRRGMHNTRLSLLESILTATNQLPLTNLEQTMKQYYTYQHAASAKQEMYNKNIDEILYIMKNGDLRATWFINMFECIFDINIYIFGEGKLLVPNHTMSYYKLQPRKKTIFIYQHWGSDADAPSYPQCELMVRMPRDNPKEQQFIFEDNISTSINIIFNKLIDKYKINKTNVTQLHSIILPDLPIVSQYIDIYGKCRQVNINYNNTMMTLIIDPSPPFIAPISSEIHRAPLDQILEMVLAHSSSMDITIQRGHNGILSELGISLGNIDATILVQNDTHYMSGITYINEEKYDIYRNEQRDLFTEMIELRKIYKLITQNSLYLISKFVGPRPLTSTLLRQFTDQHVIIDEMVDYQIENITRFSDPNNSMVRDGNIVIPSYEIWKRVVFYIMLFYRRHREQFYDYKNFIHIPHLFSSSIDYKVQTREYIFDGVSSVNNLIKKDTKDRLSSIVKHIIPDTNEIYFFQNTSINDNIYLAQNVDSYGAANYVLYTWLTHQYNPGPDISIFDENDESDLHYNFGSDSDSSSDVSLVVKKKKRLRRKPKDEYATAGESLYYSATPYLEEHSSNESTDLLKENKDLHQKIPSQFHPESDHHYLPSEKYQSRPFHQYQELRRSKELVYDSSSELDDISNRKTQIVKMFPKHYGDLDLDTDIDTDTDTDGEVDDDEVEYKDSDGPEEYDEILYNQKDDESIFDDDFDLFGLFDEDSDDFEIQKPLHTDNLKNKLTRIPFYNFPVYSYTNQDDIELLYGKPDPSGCILAYNVHGSPKYTVLMLITN